MEQKRIQFDFIQKKFDSGYFAVEKADNGGIKHRYLEGIASGIYVDGHGERMTQHCIESFIAQAKAGDILLYEGLHGVNFVDDVGLLVDASITPEGQWWVSFRLYDETDNMGAATLEKADKVWRQANGLPPYKTPKKRGFSIEGDIPEGGIKSVDESGRREMDDVKLDGVVLVNRPAYAASVAHPVYKALGIVPPWSVRKSLQSSLESKMQAAGAREEYWQKYYQLQDALDSEIKRIVSDSVEPENELNDLFVEYSKVAVSLILEYPQMYKNETEVVTPDQSVQKSQSRTRVALAGLESNLRLLLEVKKSQKGNQL